MYAFTLNRTTLGYEVRAVGFNPEAARYGGISVARNYFLAMAIAGAFAGLAGSLDSLGWQFRLDITQIQGATIGFTGIAVALLGRNTAVGVGLAALLFAALDTGTASRNLDPEIFDPELASSLSIIIQGLVVLFVGAQLVIVLLLAQSEPLASRKRRMSTLANRVPDGRRAFAGLGVVVGIVAALLMVPPITLRSPLVPIVLGLVARDHRARLVVPRRAAGSGATRWRPA